jgi:RNase P subunit RPR2
MKKKVKLLDLGAERHVCEVEKNGDWVIYTCPNCDYVRRFNPKTGDMKVERGNELALHSGEYVDPILSDHPIKLN